MAIEKDGPEEREVHWGTTLRVHHTLHELNGRLWIGEPKTRRARRQVDLPTIAIVALREHRQKMRIEGASADARVFSMMELVWMPPSIVQKAGLRPAHALARDTVLRGAAKRS